MDNVLVGVVYTPYKKYARHLYPANVDCLTYLRKKALLVTDQEVDGLSKLPTGELIAARGRDYIISYARQFNYDSILFLDVDTVPDPDAIEKMLEVNHPLVGCLHAARGNANQVIGHNYTSRDTLERVSLRREALVNTPIVDGISGGMLLVKKSVFLKVDYSGYQGPHTIPLRFTADDEFLQIKIFKQLKILPKVRDDLKSWHYSDNGRAYRCWGKISSTII